MRIVKHKIWYCVWSGSESLSEIVDFVKQVQKDKAYTKMNSREYKVIVRTISVNLLKKRFPGLDKKHLAEVANQIAVNIHARMYGANVDNVDSPIWQTSSENERPSPQIDATELLKDDQN